MFVFAPKLRFQYINIIIIFIFPYTDGNLYTENLQKTKIL